MGIQVRKKGDVSILDIGGKLTVGEEPHLREAVKNLLGEGERLFILDMTDVPFMDSAGLGETAACKMRVNGRGGTLKLVLSRKSKVGEIFHITGLDQSFEIFYDVEAAIASFID